MTEDTKIIGRIIGGDIEAFGSLVQRYQRPIIAMVRNLIGDEHICEDIAQEVFFAAYKKLRTFDESQSKFSTWLFTIARNKSINYARRKRIISFGKLPDDLESNIVADTVEQAELFEKLNGLLDKLPNAQKRAFTLAEFENLSYEDIAQIEGVRLGTVRSRIHRAKKKIAKALKNYKAD